MWLKGKAAVNSLREIASHIRKCRQILVTAHIMPDGDSIGSLLGLGLGLQAAGYHATMFSADGVPNRFRFLAGTEQVASGQLPAGDFDCVIALDCSDHLRLSPVWDQLKDKFVINIDHHPTNTLYGSMNHLDTSASATGELVYALLRELEISLNEAVAAAIYVAVSTDTGSFKFESTTARTHHIAAALLRAGVRPGRITPQLFDRRSRAAIFALRQALCSLTFSEDGKIAWFIITEEDMERAGAMDEDLDGVVNYAKNIEGVEAGLLFRQKKDGTVKVGLRSHTIDVGKVAAALGGGGHARAAGCSVEADLQGAVKTVFAALAREL